MTIQKRLGPLVRIGLRYPPFLLAFLFRSTPRGEIPKYLWMIPLVLHERIVFLHIPLPLNIGLPCNSISL